jgi:predicted dehydrogenase
MRLMNRRDVLQAGAVAAGVAVLPIRSARAYAANEALAIAGIGVGGRGGSHVQSTLASGENLVAACDASESAVRNCLRRVEEENKKRGLDRPAPKAFSDYRELFDTMEKEIDAVFVGAPDHHHAPASMRAIARKKHVYCEKPLTHTIDEARRLAQAARERKVATQMGNQGRADEGWRTLCEYIEAGAVGAVKEIHIWTDRPGIPKRFWWPQGGTRPAGANPVPPGLNWDAWLGPAPERPYLGTYPEGKFKGKHVYQPFVWRGWWDFGTGALGDIGCHSMSGIYSALKIESASAVELVKDSGDATDEMFPSASVLRWDIPARGAMPPCKLFWYDGGLYPDPALFDRPAEWRYPDNGRFLIGEKGKLNFSADDRPPVFLDPAPKDFQPPPKTLPRCASDHFKEWVAAAKGGRPAFSHFDHAGPLTEFVLLGNLAIRAGVGKKVEWDGAAMRCTNRPELNALVKRPHRKGWEG